MRWVRRKAGPDISTWRYAEGKLAVAVPCVLCRREIMRFGFRLQCPLGPDEVFYGRLDEADAPISKLTTGQRRQFTHLSDSSARARSTSRAGAQQR